MQEVGSLGYACRNRILLIAVQRLLLDFVSLLQSCWGSE